jgi:RimJ/RimL family protein N-acetyltransferase
MITNPRLKVRPLETTDYESYCQLENDARVKQFSGGPIKVEETTYLDRLSTLGLKCIAVCTKEDGRFIGRCGFRDVDGRIELEIFLSPEVHGKGLGGELFDAMISHCAMAFPTAKIGASVSPLNLRAVKLLESRGFQDTCETITLRADP